MLNSASKANVFIFNPVAHKLYHMVNNQTKITKGPLEVKTHHLKCEEEDEEDSTGEHRQAKQ